MAKHGWRGKDAAVCFLVGVVVLALDRLSKSWASGLTPGDPVQAIPGILGWRYVRNTGVAFSALQNAGALLCLLTAAIIAAAVVWLVRHPACGGWLRTGLSLLIAGGLGNLFDRIVFGYVIDFIEALFVRFAIFNLADVAVVCGVGCMMIGMLRGEGERA